MAQAYPEKAVETPGHFSRHRPQMRRWLALLIALGAILLMGFYTVTDNARLAHDHVLQGADWLGYAVCHRITARSFSINGRQLPLCARCTGMYLGVTMTFIVYFLSGRLRRSEFPSIKVMAILVGFIAVMGIDGVNSYLHFFPDAPHLYAPRNWLRLVTGSGTGVAMGVFVFPALAQTLWRRPDPFSGLTTMKELGGLLLVMAAAVMLVLSNQPTVLYLLGILSALGVLIATTSIATVLFLLVIRRDGRATKWRETAVPLTVGMCLALATVIAIGVMRFSLTGTMAGFPGLS